MFDIHKKSMLCLGIAVLLSSTHCFSAITITESYTSLPDYQTSSDWLEVSNSGSSTESITGLYYDDSSGDPTVGGNEIIPLGFTTLAPSEVMIVFLSSSDNGVSEIAEFENIWGVNGLKYAWMTSGDAMSEDGESIFLFDGGTAGANTLSVFTYPARSTNNPVLNLETDSVVIAQDGVLGSFNSAANVGDSGQYTLTGSPGIIPEPSYLLMPVIVFLCCVASRHRKVARQ